MEKNDPEVMGVYSHSTKYEYKVKERSARYRHGTYWYVRKISEEDYEIRPLNANHLPTSGCKKIVGKEEFLKYYTPELDYYNTHTQPCLESLQKKVRMGRKYFNMGNLDKAEALFCKAVLMDDENVEANMGLGEVYSEQKRFTLLREVLDKLMNNDDTFAEEQRHQFNEFGIHLRKKELFDDAIRFYLKALQVNAQDENLHFNISRAFLARGKIKNCKEHLQIALELNPQLSVAADLLAYVERMERKKAR